MGLHRCPVPPHPPGANAKKGLKEFTVESCSDLGKRGPRMGSNRVVATAWDKELVSSQGTTLLV